MKDGAVCLFQGEANGNGLFARRDLSPVSAVPEHGWKEGGVEGRDDGRTDLYGNGRSGHVLKELTGKLGSDSEEIVCSV